MSSTNLPYIQPITYPYSFPLLPKKPLKFPSDNLKNVLIANITHPLLFNCLINLSCCYFDTNIFMNHQAYKFSKLCLKTNLICLRELQFIINNPHMLRAQYDIAVLGSLLLNLTNLCHVEDNDLLFIFSNGLLDLVKNKNVSTCRCQFLSNLGTYSKSLYFPPYNVTCLYEFRSVLHSFGEMIVSENVRNRFVLLYNYIGYLLHTCETNPQQEYPPVLLKRILQKWLAILPSNMELFQIARNISEEETVLLLFFKSLSKLLDSIFPKIMFYNLHTFSTSYNNNNPIINFQPMNPQFQPLIHYCLRIHHFFDIRLKSLSAIFTNNISNINQLTSSINEVQIHNFFHSIIKPYNYIHFPLKITLPDLYFPYITKYFNKNNTISHHLYDYNHHHIDHFKFMIVSYLNDPILNHHLMNRGFSRIVRINTDPETFGFEQTLFAKDSDILNIQLIQSYEELFMPSRNVLGGRSRIEEIIENNDKEIGDYDSDYMDWIIRFNEVRLSRQ